MRGEAPRGGGRGAEGVGRQRRKRHARGGPDERHRLKAPAAERPSGLRSGLGVGLGLGLARLPLSARRLILLHLIHDALQPVCSAEDLRGQMYGGWREIKGRCHAAGVEPALLVMLLGIEPACYHGGWGVGGVLWVGCGVWGDSQRACGGSCCRSVASCSTPRDSRCSATARDSCNRR